MSFLSLMGMGRFASSFWIGCEQAKLREILYGTYVSMQDRNISFIHPAEKAPHGEAIDQNIADFSLRRGRPRYKYTENCDRRIPKEKKNSSAKEAEWLDVRKWSRMSELSLMC